MKRERFVPVFLSVFVTAVSFFCTSVFSQTLVQRSGDSGSVDWSKAVIKATGIGAPNMKLPEAARRPSAIEAAKQLALRNLLQTIKGVRLSSETTVENFMVSSDVVRTRVEGIARGFRVVDTRYMDDGSVEVDVEMSLRGELADVLLPETGGGEPISGLVCPCCGQPWPAGRPVPEGVKPVVRGVGDKGRVYTGLVVDTRGLGVQPAMAPRVMTEGGREVYGAGFVTRDYAIQQGVVGYGKDVAKAAGDERVTDKPFVVKAVRASGPGKCDVIISEQDALALHGKAENLEFLKQCRVFFVVD
ncbi:MAG: LPP20 family lipoprotein [Candidatus Eisenbacteria bacterium]|nr:LPP20 family lipoprotein [Candidatus Eisenbacteria bacterium]